MCATREPSHCSSPVLSNRDFCPANQPNPVIPTYSRVEGTQTSGSDKKCEVERGSDVSPNTEGYSSCGCTGPSITTQCASYFKHVFGVGADWHVSIVEVGAPAKVLIHLQSGRNHVVSATIKLNAPAGVQFEFARAMLENEGMCGRVPPWCNCSSCLGSAKLQATGEVIILSDLEEESTAIVSLPHSDVSSYHTLVSHIILLPHPR